MKKEVGLPDFIKLEKDTLKFWDDNKCFEKLVEKNKNNERFRFLDGPITANNRSGVHHIFGRTLKDITIKYNAMKGKDCHYQNGFDAQGMWVEVNVEKELGLNGKPEILDYGMDKFTRKCMERVNYFANEITNQSIRMGQWMDWKNSYFTNTDENITAIWYFLKKCNENGWIIRKNRPMVWCPRCGTSLSEHEMAGSYHDVTHTAIFAKFPVKGKDFKMVAWTTTPWTLSANVALAVNPDNDYILVLTESGEKLVVGKEALKVIKGETKVLEEFKGEKLVGLEYETCFPELSEQQFAHKIVPWEDVDSNEGCGVVHIAPGCGAEDFELGKRYNLPEICPIDDQGVMLDNTGFLAGHKTTEVVDMVVDRLKADGKLMYAHPYKHSYPFCWRCKTDLVYKLISTWYIDMNPIRPMLIKALDEVEFQPEYGKKRMLDWLNNMGDWNISRSRFYGLPLPFYVCKKCGKVHVIGSLDELRKKAVNPKEIDKLPNLHRPWIDNVKIKCDECGETVERVPEVGDCWLDAGITPFSTKKYFTDKEFFKKNFPSEFVCEMIEQIKLWFYSLLVMSVVLTGHAPYTKVVTYQYVKDENGNEFHKSGGNSLDCDVVADKVGADAIRYVYGGANPVYDIRFGYTLTDEARRKMMGLWNAYTFFNTYASIDNPDIAGYKPDFKSLNITDKWLLTTVNDFVKKADEYYSSYRSYLVVKDFETLMDDLTNFYIRINRRRFWKSENKKDQMDAYYCLYHALKEVTLVMAPIVPFMTEYIWQNMVREVEKNEAEFVLAGGFPTFNKDYVFDGVIEKANIARDIITVAQRLRNENQIKVKQPLKTMYLMLDDSKKSAVREFESIIKDELNIKEIVFESDSSKFNEVFLGVNFKTAGAVLKGDVQRLKAYLASMDAKSMAKAVEEYNNGSVKLDGFDSLNSDIFTLNHKPKADFVIANSNGVSIVLDITIDESLMKEGLSRELIRAIQILRKEANFNIEQRISLYIETEDETLKDVVNTYKDKIISEALVNNYGDMQDPTIDKTVEIGDESVRIKLKD